MTISKSRKNIMPEQQTTEYKSSWHEEYLDWICGFANAKSADEKGKFYKIYYKEEN